VRWSCRLPTAAPTNVWVKKTCTQRETLPIAGFALDGKKFDGIYLGRHKGRELLYAGKVDHGFDNASEKELVTGLKPLMRKTQPYTKKIAHRGISSLHSRRKSSTGQSLRKAKCVIRSSKVFATTYDRPHARECIWSSSGKLLSDANK
jgi:ATP-dependent DNA ligase